MDKKEVRKKIRGRRKNKQDRRQGKKILPICILYRSQDFQKGREDWMREKEVGRQTILSYKLVLK